MGVIDTITSKEKCIRDYLDRLRSMLNSKRVEYNKNTNDWSYLTILSHTNNKLKEIIEYIESSPK